VFVLSRDHIRNLKEHVDARVQIAGCDHSHRFTRAWAEAGSISWEDLLDVLEANGGHCDCEAVLNLPDDADLSPPSPAPAAPAGNAWRLPESFACSEHDTFTRRLLCDPAIARNTHAAAGEMLVPAPHGAKPRKRVRASMHFFVGCPSGLPAEFGVVREAEPISAADFARWVVGSGVGELSAFTFREAAFLLSKLAPLSPGTAVGTHFMETSGVVGKREELRVHKVLVR
jgi:hypothetical protein